jgi:hypothetical protein
VGTDGGRLQIRERTAAPGVAAVPADPSAAAADPSAAAAADPSAAAVDPSAAAVDPSAAAAADPSAAAAADGVPRRERGRFWREDKVGLLMAMASPVSATDPCPDIPESFLDPTRMGKLARQLHKGVPVTEEAAGEAADPAAEQAAYQEGTPRWQPPKVQEKRLVASRQSWDAFGPLVAAAAWAMGLFGSARRAFLGDGADTNWTLWRHYFSSFEPVLDFIHARSYVYAAAHAGRDRVAGWRCYVGWIRWVWRGEVGLVLAALRQRQAELGQPAKGEAESSPRQVVARALGYLGNNERRMRYAEYRRQGLPITSSYVESAVKQFNQRVKGTEKFWGEEGAEAILQLRADHLSEHQPLEGFWQRRQAAATGQRPYRRAG